ncbi:F-box protein At5g46170-like [Coffea arabica]|uniref:F-box protein At5g46170-like n=1 Tax=Coffea arabica TaxID=13443 RepID=A0A6P6X806_COFAR|nr:F-box protein At5g46170-like [Coffea arabica]
MKDSIEGDPETHIYHLPDELLVFLFNKLVDAKCLCRCYIVSKRFASIITQIHDVSFAIPSRNINNISNQQNDLYHEESFAKNVLQFFVDNIYTKPVRYLRYIFLPKPPLSVSFDPIVFRAFTKFLKKLGRVKSLHVELPSFHENQSVLKWEAEFGSELSFCVVLFATTFRIMQMEDCENDVRPISLTNELLRSRSNHAIQRLMDALWRNHIVRHVIEDHKELKDLTVSDSNKEGTLCLGENQIAELHDLSPTLPTSGYVKIWHAPIMHLLTSGHVMEGATVVMVRLLDQQSADEDRIMNRVFKEEEVFREAAKEIYENYKTDALTYVIELNIP